MVGGSSGSFRSGWRIWHWVSSFVIVSLRLCSDSVVCTVWHWRFTVGPGTSRGAFPPLRAFADACGPQAAAPGGSLARRSLRSRRACRLRPVLRVNLASNPVAGVSTTLSGTLSAALHFLAVQRVPGLPIDAPPPGMACLYRDDV